MADQAGVPHISLYWLKMVTVLLWQPPSIFCKFSSVVMVTHCYSNLFSFGSKVVSESSGIILNNEMDDFLQPGWSNGYGLPEGPHNYIEPGKRSQSSTAPIIMLNKSASALVIGASGGSTITTATLLAAVNHLFFNYPISEAIEYPRIHHQWLPDVVRYDVNFSTDYLDSLRHWHYNLTEVHTLAVIQGITQPWADSEIFAHSDSCKGGTPDGYKYVFV